MQDEVKSGLVVPAADQAPLRHGVPHALQAMRAIVLRELMKFARQYGRLVSALVRPVLWLAVFAAGSDGAVSGDHFQRGNRTGPES